MRSVVVLGPMTNGVTGGQATHMKNLNALADEIDDGIVEFFFTSRGMDETESVKGKIIFFLENICKSLFVLGRYSKVHINTSFDAKAIVRDFFYILVSFLYRKEVVIQYHGGDPFKINAALRTLSKISLFFIKNGSSVICLTDKQFNFVTSLKVQNVGLVKNFVDVPDFQAKDLVSPINFIYMGRIIKEKGLFIILDAVEWLRKHSTVDFKVQICGNGKDLAEMLNEIERRGLNDSVIYHGIVGGVEKIRLLESSQIFLYPTSYPEGLPYSILEALAYSLPVVSTNVGSISSVVHDKETGIIVAEKNYLELAKAMEYFIQNGNEIRRMGTQGHLLVADKFGKKAMKDFFVNLWFLRGQQI
ncbi:MAG: glycosyltransferase family 4 protein [Rheinheimera sp.]|nr:glycosyltransferase family 4 protein [Rheinheimera sp.]